jgi:protein TonB
MIPLPTPLSVLTVRLLTDTPLEPRLKPPAVDLVLPKPKPVARQPQPAPVEVPMVLATPESSPAVSASAVPPVPTLPVPAPAPLAPPPVAPAVAATPPRFDANYLDNPKPNYPPLSRRSGEEGKVVLRVRVDAEGNASDVQLHAGSGFERLDNAALTTVRRWKFIPARSGGEFVAATVLVPIVFSLKD